jgi:NTE family protein
MRLLNTIVVAGLALLSACQTVPPVTIPQTVVQVPQGPPPKPKIALVLGGGAARGFAHVGVIRALEQEKIPIDMVVGTSVGGLIGAIYASDLSSFDLEWTAFQLEKEDIFDFGVLNAVAGMGFAKGDKLEAWVKSHIKTTNIESLKIPFAAVATDLNWGYKVVLDTGSVARAIRASAAIPGVFQPVQHQGKILVDGGVVDNIPISVAKAKGADIVIAVDISGNVGNTNITNLLGVTLQATNIMFALNVEQSKKNADILITPAGIGDIGMLDFTQKKRCMQAGIEATKQSMPAIRQVIEAWVAAHSRPPAPAR